MVPLWTGQWRRLQGTGGGQTLNLLRYEEAFINFTESDLNDMAQCHYYKMCKNVSDVILWFKIGVKAYPCNGMEYVLTLFLLSHQI